MAVQKNQCIPLEITGLTSEGSGVGRYEGEAVFVPGTAPGDRITARIVKDCKRYAYGIVDKLEQPGPGRREEDCPICRPCGGCCFPPPWGGNQSPCSPCSCKTGSAYNSSSSCG